MLVGMAESLNDTQIEPPVVCKHNIAALLHVTLFYLSLKPLAEITSVQ